MSASVYMSEFMQILHGLKPALRQSATRQSYDPWPLDAQIDAQTRRFSPAMTAITSGKTGANGVHESESQTDDPVVVAPPLFVMHSALLLMH